MRRVAAALLVAAATATAAAASAAATATAAAASAAAMASAAAASAGATASTAATSVAATASAAATSAAATDGQLVTIARLRASEALVTYNAKDLSGRRELYVAPAGHDLSAPQWSPDGNRIVFADAAAGLSAIKVIEVATGTVGEVGPGTAPSWSPDGRRIALVHGTRIVTRLVDGGAEVALPLDGTGVRDLAWSPDGETLALWTSDDTLELASMDGDREVWEHDVPGGAAWAPDAGSFVYPQRRRERGAVVLVQDWGDEAEDITHAPAADADPDFAPSGTDLIFTRDDMLGQLTFAASSASFRGGGFAEPDWQPCVAGVTSSCTSVTPAPGRPAPACEPVTPLATAPGRRSLIPVRCTKSSGLEIVEAPAHGKAVAGPRGAVEYTAAQGYVGPDAFAVRAVGTGGRVSPVIRVAVTVAPKPLTPAAPRLTVIGTPKLDRRGRVRVIGTCDRACVVSLKVRVKLRTGRVIEGRRVRAQAPAGGRVTLRLRRGALPRGRRVAWVRVSGRVVGADRRERQVILNLPR